MRFLPLLALGIVLAFGRAQGQSESRPNFVVILADDLTFRDVGCYGGQARTPHLDRLAREGTRFKGCFQAAPMCSPSRHCLYTGLYPVRSGAYPNHAFAQAGTQSIAHALRPAGYRVALSGKLHVGPPEVFPFEHSAVNKSSPDFEAIEELLRTSRATDTPFCLFVCSHEPHSPWTLGDPTHYPPESLRLPPTFVDTPETRVAFARYLAEVEVFDADVGRTLALLDVHGLRENTLVIALTEQGSSLPFAKWTLYDAGIQSACLARWPGRVAAGAESAALIEYVDFLPTLVAAAGIPVPDGLDGASFLEVLLGRATSHKEHVFALQTTRGTNRGAEYFGIRGVRSEHYKYIRNLTPEVEFDYPQTRSGFFHSWQREAALGKADAADRVRRVTHRPAEELYALVSDPYEWNNLAADPTLAEVKAALAAELEGWMASQGDLGQATELAALAHQARNRDEDDDDRR